MTTTAPNSPNILDILEVNYTTYDNYREQHFQQYCKSLAEKFFMSYQVLNRHDYMRNYFMDKWLVYVEAQFIKNYSDYFPYCEPDMKRNIFAEYTETLLRNGRVQMYPLPLVKEIRKQNFIKTAN